MASPWECAWLPFLVPANCSQLLLVASVLGAEILLQCRRQPDLGVGTHVTHLPPTGYPLQPRARLPAVIFHSHHLSLRALCQSSQIVERMRDLPTNRTSKDKPSLKQVPVLPLGRLCVTVELWVTVGNAAPRHLWAVLCSCSENSITAVVRGLCQAWQSRVLNT